MSLHVKLHKLLNGELRSFAHSFESIDEAQKFIANTPNVDSAQIYDNGDLVQTYEAPAEPVSVIEETVVVEPTPEPVIEETVVEIPVVEVVEEPVVESVAEEVVETTVETAPEVTETPEA